MVVEYIQAYTKEGQRKISFTQTSNLDHRNHTFAKYDICMELYKI